MIDQLPMAVVVVNAPIIGALTTCHPRLCYSPPVDRERRRFTSCSVTNCRRLRFSSQDVGSKQAETDQPTLDGLLPGLRGTGHTAAPTTLALCGHLREHRRTRLTKHQAVEPSDRQTIAASYRSCPSVFVFLELQNPQPISPSNQHNAEVAPCATAEELRMSKEYKKRPSEEASQ
jgi:hypothetical protein